MPTPMSTSLKKILSCSLFVPSTALASIISGTGEEFLDLNMNIGLSCAAAESKAIKDALNSFSQKEFVVSKKNYCYDVKNYAYCNYYVENDYTVAGTVKRVVSKKETIKNGICKVDLVLDVEKSRYIEVDVSGKNIYFTGEPLQFNVKAKEELYLYVFSIHRKGIDVLFPYSITDDNLVNEDYVFPGNGKQYVNYLDKGVKQEEETILFLFTKHHVEFDRYTLNKKTLYEIINSIPNFSKRTFTYNILIKRK